MGANGCDAMTPSARSITLLEKAIDIALKAHAGQKDKAGAPYVLHPLRLMLQMQTDEEKMAAVLHDVVEDSKVTLDDLRAAGFPKVVIDAVALLTRKGTDTYEQFVQKIKPHPLARRVKLADLRDNLRLDRIAHPTDADVARLEKYNKALSYLESE